MISSAHMGGKLRWSDDQARVLWKLTAWFAGVINDVEGRKASESTDDHFILTEPPSGDSC